MAEEKKERWLTYMAITTVLIAVAATLSTFKGGGYSTKSLLNQTQASDQWAFYQSKSIKGYIYEMRTENLEIQVESLEKQKGNEALIKKYNEKIDDYKKSVKKYEDEKETIKKTAASFENQRDECKKHSGKFGIGVIFLQISILLSSIATLSKKKFVWICGLVLGIFGLFYFIDGFFLFL
jgi:FlaG/FlaF family flagellin (archaellin)